MMFRTSIITYILFVSRNILLKLSNKIHHVAVICSDYEQSKLFYTEVLDLKIVS